MSGFVAEALTYTIPWRKVSDYLLDETHSRGASKARFFLAFGFRRDAPHVLSAELVRTARSETYAGEALTPLGAVKRVFEARITAPDGRTPRVRTIWQEIPGTDDAEFVTAIPMPDRGGVVPAGRERNKRR